MQTFTKKVIFLCFIIGIYLNVHASHAVGGEVTYRWLSNKKYEITARMYRDCRGMPLSYPTCKVRNDSVSFSLSLTRVSIKDITIKCVDTATGPCYPSNSMSSSKGYELHTFLDTIDLGDPTYNSLFANGNCKIYFTLEQCCRNGALIILNPGSFYVDAMLDVCKANFKNNSPSYNIINTLNATCNQPFFQNYGARDFVDFDSVGYEMVTPQNGFNSKENYYNNYKPTIPMTPYCPPYYGKIDCSPMPTANPPRGFYFDALTGSVVFTPSSCDEVGVIAVKSTEYRKDSANNWVAVGYVVRDIQLVVKTDANNYIPEFIINKAYTFNIAKETCIDIKTYDTSSISGIGDVTSVKLIDKLPGMKFSLLDSSARLKTARLCWKPHDSDYLKINSTGDIKYIPMVIEVKDNYCPMPSVVQKGFVIKLHPRDSSGTLNITTFYDKNKNAKMDFEDSLISINLKLKNKASNYYVKTVNGNYQNNYKKGNITISTLPHPYIKQISNDTTIFMKMDSIHNASIGVSLKSGIYGKIYVDANNNCKYDIGEITPSGIIVQTDSGKYSGVSNNEGFYYIDAPQGTYTLTCNYPAGYMAVSCPNNGKISITINGYSAYLNNNFGVTKNPNYTDLATFISLGKLTNGGVGYVNFICRNNGNKMVKNVKLLVPGNSKIGLSDLPLTLVNKNNSRTFKIDSIMPNQEVIFKCGFNIDSSLFTTGETLCFKVSVESIKTLADSFKTNNVYTICGVINGTYDANSKVNNNPNSTPLTKTVDYTISFQNKGTDSARRVIVTDTIDKKYFDLSQFKLNWSDYPCEPIISDNIITFIFDNINLPYLSLSGDKSIAKFNFTLGLKAKDIIQDTYINNRAAIYLDSENPILTKYDSLHIISPISIYNLSQQSICKNKKASFTYDCRFNPENNNVFKLELSDINGSFSNPNVIEQVQSSNSTGNISFQLPQGIATGNYKLRLVSTNPQAVGFAPTGELNISAIDLPSNSFTSNIINNEICANDTLKLSFNNASYTYQVSRNNVVVSPYSNTLNYNFPYVNKNESFLVSIHDGATDCYDTIAIKPLVNNLPLVSIAIPNLKSKYCSGDSISINASGASTYTYSFNQNTLIANTSNSYNSKLTNTGAFMAIGTDTNGCVNSSDTINVNVLPLPNANLLLTPNPACSGDSIFVMLHTASKFDIYKNNTILYNQISDNKKYIANAMNGDKFMLKETSNSTGCSNTSAETELIIHNLPLKPVITNNNNDLSVTTNAKVIKWYRNNTLTNDTTKTILNAPSGKYYVEIIDSNGCVNVSDTFLMKNTGVDDIHNLSIKLYPNPTNGIVNIVFEENTTTNLTIYNTLGQIVYSKLIENKSNETIDISDLNSGIYYLQFSSDDKIVFYKKFSLSKL